VNDPHALDHHDHIRELTSPHSNAERYTRTVGRTTVTQNHVVRVPPLLRQLEWIAPTGRGDDRSGGGYESRPAAALEALNTLVQIDTDAARWLRVLGFDDFGDPYDVLRRLSAKVVDVDACHRKRFAFIEQPGGRRPCCLHHQITRDIASWWTQARIISGWDAAAWRPDNTCPMCSDRGSLRIKDADKIGFCTSCHETWTPDTIGLLAEHIRLESWERRVVKAAAAVCWCPVPQPAFERWPPLCPACGSRYCHRAVAADRMAG
jgi:hypothetical protein